MDTEAVAVLVAAAAAGSLSGAARRLGLTPMTASRRLAALERTVGVRLVHRSTRALALTAEGELFLPYAQALVEDAAAARAALHVPGGSVSGLLRVSASAAFGRKMIAPLIPGLLRAHPGLRIDLDLTDQVIDIVSEGIDLAIRIARLRDNRLIAHRLAPSPRLLCAAPSYLAERGTPEGLADLAGHECLTLSRVPEWIFLGKDGTERRARVAGRFSASTMDGLLAACRAGAGILLVAEWNVREDLRAGTLQAINLADARQDPLSIWAVYPTSRLVAPKVRVFLAALEGALAAP